MRSGWGIITGGALLAAATAAATGAAAQDSPGSAEAFTPEDDLDCAMYVGALMAESQAELTPESRVALTSAFTYFTGRFEAKRGIGLTEAFSERYPVYIQSDPAQISQICSVRMRSFGARLERAGRALSELAPAATQDESAPAEDGPAG